MEEQVEPFDVKGAVTTRARTPRKLEKKHSCSDLNSRLKTRKLLGVGQTPDGDVHRSKLSQILGHSEQLYTVQPRGLELWRYINTVGLTGTALVSLLMPRYATCFAVIPTPTTWTSTLPHRLHGSALLAISVLLWKTIRSTDSHLIQSTLLASFIYWPLHTTLSLFSLLSGAQTPPTPNTFSSYGVLAVGVGMAAGCYYFYMRLRDDRPPRYPARRTPSEPRAMISENSTTSTPTLQSDNETSVKSATSQSVDQINNQGEIRNRIGTMEERHEMTNRQEETQVRYRSDITGEKLLEETSPQPDIGQECTKSEDKKTD